MKNSNYFYFFSLFILALLIIVGTSCNPSYKDFDLPNRGLCAHRGAMDTHPENTLLAFETAVEAGAHMIELDLWLTNDNQLVVLHDRTVDRTTNGSGKVGDFSFEEIRKLDAGSWKGEEFAGQFVPTFEEVLDILPYNVWINVHIKGAGELPRMAAKIIEEKGRVHQAFLACNLEAAKQAKEIVPQLLICNMERKGSPSNYVNMTIEAQANFIQITTIDYPEIERDIKLLKDNNIKINYFGTDSPQLIRKLLTMGVDFPLVNNIIAGQKVVKDLDIAPVVPKFNN